MNRNKAKQRAIRGRRTSHWMLAMLAFAALGTSIGACNLIVESATDQCTTTSDCSKFSNGSVCLNGLCVLSNGGSSSSSSSSGMGGGGGMGGSGACFSGTPTTDPEFFNHCTNATCVEFDNCARLGLCDGATLPALIDPPAP